MPAAAVLAPCRRRAYGGAVVSAAIDQTPLPADDAWRAHAPPFDAWMPGGRTPIYIEPAPRWPIELRNARLIHGAVSAILGDSGVAHDPHVPMFALQPLPGGRWSLITTHHDVIAVAAGASFVSAIAEQRSIVRFGHVERLRAPIVGPGPRRIRINALSPVSVRRTVRNAPDGHGKRYCHTSPTSENIGHAIGRQFRERFSLPEMRARVELVRQRTDGERVAHGGKIGESFGWTGSVELLVNAPALFLLRLAEVVGLGGRTAFGLGRIRVEELL